MRVSEIHPSGEQKVVLCNCIIITDVLNDPSSMICIVRTVFLKVRTADFLETFGTGYRRAESNIPKT
jgi:hypothetical protein